MIGESEYWKRDLLRTAAGLDARRKQRRWPEVSLARTEQSIMLGFYSVRKLIDSRKLTDALVAKKLRLVAFSPRFKKGARIAWPVVSAHYDLESERPVAKDLRFVCNQVIHSHLFSLCTAIRGGFDGVFVASDFEHHQALYYLSARTIASTFRAVARDDVAAMSLYWQEHLQRFEIHTFRSREVADAHRRARGA